MKRRWKRQSGGAATEAAICLPWILVIVGATIELSAAIFLKESLTIAAYEGARVAVTRNADNQMVIDRIETVLAERRINLNGANAEDLITITPAANQAEMLEPITITVSVPIEGNTILPFPWSRFVDDEEFVAEVVMRKEFTLEN